MSAAVVTRPLFEGVATMSQSKPRLEDTREDLREIISDLLALKMMARDGIQTHLSQRDLVKHLNAKELAAVARGVSLAEKRQQPIYTRTTEVKQ